MSNAIGPIFSYRIGNIENKEAEQDNGFPEYSFSDDEEDEPPLDSGALSEALGLGDLSKCIGL